MRKNPPLLSLSKKLLIIAGLSLTVPALAKTVTLASADNNTAICLIEGDSIEITLPSGTPEAYKWRQQLTKPSPLTAMHDNYTPAKDPKAIGTQTFRFNAASVGETTLTLNFQKQKSGPAPEVTQTYSIQVTVASGEPKLATLLGAYKGTTACADCTGIQTELRLYAKGPNNFTDTIFISTRTYQGGRNGDQAFTDRGEWAVLKGDANDPNATVYALDPDQPKQTQYFLLATGGTSLTQLDQKMKPIQAPPQYQSVLKRGQ
jgi:copper homeostasis protein (lipoprotein)